jgi:hypothetical protein
MLLVAARGDTELLDNDAGAGTPDDEDEEEAAATLSQRSTAIAITHTAIGHLQPAEVTQCFMAVTTTDECGAD